MICGISALEMISFCINTKTREKTEQGRPAAIAYKDGKSNNSSFILIGR